ncbi:MAG TPA: hypothetical protein VEA99_14595 [Gemmatimonadaceae bacterium]|nr:hypothetical protein [Gemmatimonadaceae bacterium]
MPTENTVSSPESEIKLCWHNLNCSQECASRGDRPPKKIGEVLRIEFTVHVKGGPPFQKVIQKPDAPGTTDWIADAVFLTPEAQQCFQKGMEALGIEVTPSTPREALVTG